MSAPDPLRISCDECALQHSDACADCVVTFICTREPDDAVVVDVAELRALRALGDGGLLPRLRHDASAPAAAALPR